MGDEETRPWLGLYPSGTPGRIKVEHRHALELFRAAVQRAAAKPAIHYFDATLSYAEVDRMSDALAAAFAARGVGRGDRVALFLQNVPQFVITLVAAWKIGAIAVSINPMNREREVDLLLADSQPKVLVAHESGYADVARGVLQKRPVPVVVTTSELEFQSRNDPRLFAKVRRQRSDETLDFGDLVAQHGQAQLRPVDFAGSDTAMLVYTSGTTGLPKGAMNTHGNIAFTAQVYRDWMRLREGGGNLAIAPLFHITGLIGNICASFMTASPLVLAYRFDAGVMLDALDEYKPEFSVAAITALIAMMNHPNARPDSLRCLRCLYSGGAPVAPAVVEQFEAKFGLYIHIAYGLTESTSPAVATPLNVPSPVDPTFGALSIGVPLFDTDVRIADAATGAPLPYGEAGEVLIRGPQIIAGYWNKPKETAEAIRDHWLYTGDIGVMDAKGWLYLVDRKKDMINASGYKVWPREVEDVLYTHPAVREAAVVGVVDQYRGETVKAVLSLKPGATATAAEITEFCKARMAAYKYPRIVEFMPELPKTVTGKILRRELR